MAADCESGRGSNGERHAASGGHLGHSPRSEPEGPQPDSNRFKRGEFVTAETLPRAATAAHSSIGPAPQARGFQQRSRSSKPEPLQ